MSQAQQPRLKAHLPAGDARVLHLQLPAPRPQHWGGNGTGRQTGVTLGSDKGSHSLVGFLLELPEEGKREVRRDHGDAPEI